ncbi:DUF1540 domain-containing protein [Calderihabitans maritimus]|nr:DUF1540 domain-containing protein [Calderihabitans maritimus]
MAGIQCSVEECAHNQNMKCHADTIQVRSVGDRTVDSSEGTCCESFKPRR